MDLQQYTSTTDAGMCQAFKDDALRVTGLQGHPQAEELYQLAWRNGHQGGFEEVFYHLYDLAQMHLED